VPAIDIAAVFVVIGKPNHSFIFFVQLGALLFPLLPTAADFFRHALHA
jgi:hypothetical protein